MATYTPPLLRKASYSLSTSDPRDFPSSLSIHTSTNQSFPFPGPHAGGSSLSLASTATQATYHPPSPAATTPLLDSPSERNQGGGGGRSTPSALNISLAPGQVNNLALKTAQNGGKPGGSQSIFQTSTLIRSRLIQIPNFPPYLSYKPSRDLTADGGTPSVVEHLWACIRLGSSLAFLVNRVGETGVWDGYLGKEWTKIEGEEMAWAEGQGAINWGRGESFILFSPRGGEGRAEEGASSDGSSEGSRGGDVHLRPALCYAALLLSSLASLAHLLQCSRPYQRR